MSIDETPGAFLAAPPHLLFRFRLRTWAVAAGAILLGLTLLGSSAVPASQQALRELDTIVQKWDWDLVGWEANAIGEKINAQFTQPVSQLGPAARAALVKDYLTHAQSIGELEYQINGMIAAKDPPNPDLLRRREAQLAVLRQQQALVRPAVEQVIQGQVGTELEQAGLSLGNMAFPPVLFTFSEPPRKLVTSPRDRIATAYYSMLQPGLPVDEREKIETEILQDKDLSAYVTNIGGLGAYPTLVIDDASLEWVLSTVAHEWTHNYLTLFPLGINYSTSPELTILNETVAEIAGNELGASALRTFYPELVREFPGKDEAAPSRQSPATEPAFDFRKEMRHTREVVDLFLKYGRVTDAEEYMEIRRQLFHENGYLLRKLNQAYFAFHGSYGTGPASSSPIGPKLERLRSRTPDLRTFLETVRGFTSAADLDQALATWDKR